MKEPNSSSLDGWVRLELGFNTAGRCAANADTRSMLGVDAGDLIDITDEQERNIITRHVGRVPKIIVNICKKPTLFLSLDELKLLGLSPKDTLYARKSSQVVECP